MIGVFGKQFLHFSTKCSRDDKIIFSKNDKCVSNDNELFQIFCGYFFNIISDFQIPSISKNNSDVTVITNPALAVWWFMCTYKKNHFTAKKLQFTDQKNEFRAKKLIQCQKFESTTKKRK